MSWKHLLVGAAVLVGCGGRPAQTSVGAPQPDKQDHATAVGSCGAGSWTEPASFAGLDGSYVRVGSAPKGEMAQLGVSGLSPESGSIRERGQYQRTLSAACDGASDCADAQESGTVETLPPNPAFESSLIFSLASQAQPSDLYYVLALQMSTDGARVEALCLQHPTQGSAPFAMVQKTAP
jgi:hypothetical protein